MRLLSAFQADALPLGLYQLNSEGGTRTRDFLLIRQVLLPSELPRMPLERFELSSAASETAALSITPQRPNAPGAIRTLIVRSVATWFIH